MTGPKRAHSNVGGEYPKNQTKKVAHCHVKLEESIGGEAASEARPAEHKRSDNQLAPSDDFKMPRVVTASVDDDPVDDGDTDSDHMNETTPWFPYASEQEFELYMYFQSIDTSSGDKDMLLRILRKNEHPNLNCKCSKTFFARIERTLPELKVEEFEVPARLERKQQGNSESATYVNQKTVGYISIIEIVRFFMATPRERRLLQLEFDDVGENGLVLNFNQTPIFSEILRFTDLVDFEKDSVQYSIGDIVEVTSGELVRIDELFYKCMETKAITTEMPLIAKLPLLHFRGQGFFNVMVVFGVWCLIRFCS